MLHVPRQDDRAEDHVLEGEKRVDVAGVDPLRDLLIVGNEVKLLAPVQAGQRELENYQSHDHSRELLANAQRQRPDRDTQRAEAIKLVCPALL